MTFAHYPGEDPEQTAEHVAALEVALDGSRQRGDKENVREVEAELERIRGGKTRQTRPRGVAAETREKDGE